MAPQASLTTLLGPHLAEFAREYPEVVLDIPSEGNPQLDLRRLKWVDWFNTRRLLEPIGYVPSAEYETAYHDQRSKPPAELALT